MPLILFALFVVIPIAEIATFIQVGSLVGLPMTLGGILLTAVIGAFLVRQQGFKTLEDAKSNLQSDKLPVEQVIHGIFIFVAGLLLLTPGFLTDTIGFLFLIPPVRLFLAKRIWHWLSTNASVTVSGFQTEDYRTYHDQTRSSKGFSHTDWPGQNSSNGTTIDGSAVEIDPNSKKLP